MTRTRQLLLPLLLACAATAFSQYNFTQYPGTLRQISVDTQVWGVTAAGEVYRLQNQAWVRMPGALRQVSTSQNHVYGIVAPGSLVRWDAAANNWVPSTPAAPPNVTHVAVGRNGSVAVVAFGMLGPVPSTIVYLLDPGATSWRQLPGGGFKEVANGGADGLWALHSATVAGTTTTTINAFNRAANSWASVGNGATSIAAQGPALMKINAGIASRWSGGQWINIPNTWKSIAPVDGSTLWGVDANGSIWSGVASTITTVVIDINPIGSGSTGALVPPPPPPPTTTSNFVVLGTGNKMLCMDPHMNDACGFERADKVGVYTLNMNCPSGFYDPIWGGTCWKCPDADASGGWLRSATAVTGADACWRVPKETLSAAKRVSNTPWAWDCGGGTFWDGWDGGACWSCPSTHPRRTLNHIKGADACASSLNEVKAASLVSYNGCPSPEPKTMGLTGKRQPGRPFLDIGAGWAQGQASGLCYACPVVDNDGNMLITDRNARSVMGSDGCSIRFKWQPPTFKEPGMAGLNAAGMALSTSLLDPVAFTSELYLLAAGLKIPQAQAAAWVAAEWQSVAAAPFANTSFRKALYTRLLAAAVKAPSARSPHEAALVANMENYIRAKKMFIAGQALNMYDAWKEADAVYRDKVARSPLRIVMNYGTVPLNFGALAENLTAPVGALQTGGSALISGLAVAGTARVGYEGYKIIEGVKNAHSLLIDSTESLKLASGFFQAGGGFIGAATIANIAMSALASVALDQFIAIVSARPKLENSLAVASQTINLQTMVADGPGQDLLKFYWAKAIEDGPQTEDPAVVAFAAKAAAEAKRLGYPK